MAAQQQDLWERGFSTSFRGYDQSEVREHLRILGEQLAAARSRVDELQAQLDANRSHGSAASIAELDPAAVAARLGEEAARVLRTAHEAATEMRAKASDHMDRVMREAQDDAARMRAEADVDAARRREAAAVESAAEVERAKAEGRRMIAEAQGVRERMMADLARRRDVGRRQLAQLAEGRDRLLAAYEHVRRSLDEVTGELVRSVPDAERLAGDALNRPLAGDEDLVLVPAVTPSAVAIADEERSDSQTSPSTAAESTAAGPNAMTTVAFAGELPEGFATSALGRVEPGTDVVVAAESVPDLADEVVAVAVESGDDVHLVGPIDADVDLASAAAVSSPADDAEAGTGQDLDLTDGTFAEPPAVGDAAESSVVIDLTEANLGTTSGSVDDLFARIRAARTESVAHAVEVLTADAPPSEIDEPAAERAGSATEQSVFAVRRAALELTERSVSRHLKRALADEQNEVLERLRQARQLPTVAELVGDLAEHAERYRSAVADDLRTAAIAGARSACADEAVAERMGTHAKVRDGVLAEVGMELTGIVRDRIGRCLSDGQGDPDEAAHQLRAAYRELKIQRIDALAAHFAVSAYSRGAFAAIPAGAKVCWLVDPEGPECADAEDNQLAGPIDHGVAFPTGHIAPPAHVGCRCHAVARP